MSDGILSQSDNTVFGNQAGRDIIYNLRQAMQPGLRISETISDEERDNFRDKLRDLTSLTADNRTLEEKMMAGSRTDDLDEALELKEKFAKKLHKNALSDSSMQLYVYLLSELKTFWRNMVRPKLRNGVAQDVINATLYQEYIVPTFNKVRSADLHMDTEEVQGMIYYLMAKCHISWDK